MNIESKITVGNNSSLGFDNVKITTSCIGFVSIFIPVDGGKALLEIELKRNELHEFLIRTQPTMSIQVSIDASKTNPALP